MSYLSGELNTTEETLNLLHKDANVTRSTLDTLTDEAKMLELSVQDLIQQVHLIKNSNIQGEKPDCWRKTTRFKLTELILFNRETYCSTFILDNYAELILGIGIGVDP